MELTNNFEIIMSNTNMAKKASSIMKKMLINDEGSKKMVYLAAKMNREENVITAFTDWGMECETLDVLVNKLFVAIAKECADSEFSANVDFSDCYDEKAYEIRYADHKLTITTTFHSADDEPICDCEDEGSFEYFEEDGVCGYRCCECGKVISEEEFKAACETVEKTIFDI